MSCLISFSFYTPGSIHQSTEYMQICFDFALKKVVSSHILTYTYKKYGTKHITKYECYHTVGTRALSMVKTASN